MLEDLRRAFAKSGVYTRRARGLLDALYTHGPEGFADPADRDAWSSIFSDAGRLQQLYQQVREADATWIRHALDTREAARARGTFPPAWCADYPLELQNAPIPEQVALPPWVEHETVTAAAIRRVAVCVAVAHPAVVSLILYGSLARGEARSLDDPEPSDVDLLISALLPPDPTAAEPIIGAIQEAVQRVAKPSDSETDQAERAASEIVGQQIVYSVSRDLQTMISPWELVSSWDSLFIDSVNADGIVLWARRPLPMAFEALARRAGLPASDAISA